MPTWGWGASEKGSTEEKRPMTGPLREEQHLPFCCASGRGRGFCAEGACVLEFLGSGYRFFLPGIEDFGFIEERERDKVSGKQNVKITISGKRSVLQEKPWAIDPNSLLPGQHSRCLKCPRVAQRLSNLSRVMQLQGPETELEGESIFLHSFFSLAT